MQRLLVDTGPLVALFDADDGHHARVSAFMEGFPSELLTTWPVLIETCHLIPESLVPGFMQWEVRGGVHQLAEAAVDKHVSFQG